MHVYQPHGNGCVADARFASEQSASLLKDLLKNTHSPSPCERKRQAVLACM